jgi:arsenate reductase
VIDRGPQIVLFVCERNAGRSQIAAALFNQLADPARARAISAGLNAASVVRPEVVAVMKEISVDLSAIEPIELTARMQTEVSFLVTLGCAERCPLVSAGRRADWTVPPTSGQPLERLRMIREEIRKLVADLVRDRGWA